MILLNFKRIQYISFAFFLTRKYGEILQYIPEHIEKKRLRLEYSNKMFSKLNIHVNVENKEKIPLSGQYLLFANHRSVIDPLVIDIAFKDSEIFGLWVAKKELYNSLFFGKAVRSGGCIRLDRDNSKMNTFFADIENGLKQGSSIFIFPEGTRNKTQNDLLKFKNGFGIIARKNKLPLLPVYIKSDTGKTLQKILQGDKGQQEITIVIGNIIDYSKRSNLETLYRDMFELEASPD